MPAPGHDLEERARRILLTYSLIETGALIQPKDIAKAIHKSAPGDRSHRTHLAEARKLLRALEALGLAACTQEGSSPVHNGFTAAGSIDDFRRDQTGSHT